MSSVHPAPALQPRSSNTASPPQGLLEQAFLRAPSPMLITDLEGTICGANPALEASSGYCLDELRGQRASLLRSHLQSAETYRRMWAGLRQNGQWQGEIWARRKDGRVFRQWLSITQLRDEDGRPTHFLGQYSGLTPLRQPEVQDPLGSDPITGMPNRAAFLADAERLAAHSRPLAFITLDLERFTELNEQFGLGAGDRLLRQVALRCTQVAASAGGSSLVGRVGSDEFAVAWQADAIGPDDDDEAAALAHRLLEAVEADYDLGVGRAVAVRAQLGMAWLPAGCNAVAECLLHAAAARLDNAAGSVHHYAAHERQRSIGRALHSAVHERRIGIALQPKVDLRSGSLIGLEALARWPQADGGFISPAEFIPLAERLGLIAELGDCVLEQAMAWQAENRRQGLAPVSVAVNFSAPQFNRRDLAARVQQGLDQHGLDPSLLELELTESILLGDVESALSHLGSLRDLGLKLSIDDFGTGYSSLSYLCRFPIDRVKLDRSFIANLCSDGRTLALVRSVIALAHQLGLRCVAEGIETSEQLTLLRCLGCDEGQGYLLAPPLSPQAAQQLLRDELPWKRLFQAPTRQPRFIA